jgi:hypothetical protein
MIGALLALLFVILVFIFLGVVIKATIKTIQYKEEPGKIDLSEVKEGFFQFLRHLFLFFK